MQSKHIKDMIEKNRGGQRRGLYSVCSANELVLRAAMRHALAHKYPLVIESTANQVNQYGGYTGIKPNEFIKWVKSLATEEGLDINNLIMGGDHLGPLLWQKENEEAAMAKSIELVESYTKAGFTKIHLDTSMKLADDPAGPLDPRTCARRGAILAQAVYKSFSSMQANGVRPFFVIGSEVPIPGGSQEHEDSLTPTKAEDFLEQISIYKDEFKKAGIDFNDVAAFVVQPGVEFGDDFVFLYEDEKASSLTGALKKVEGIVFEGHSTDYQCRKNLSDLVRDGVGILKVGPALTFVLREALFLLEEIEEILTPSSSRSNLKNTLLEAMNGDKQFWEKYYSGSTEEIEYKKFYSYSDRCRYYLPNEKVQKAMDKLIQNLPKIPPALLSQYFPNQYRLYMEGKLKNKPLDIIYDRIGNLCDDYAAACGYLG